MIPKAPKKKIELLAPYINRTLEGIKAEGMFQEFMSGRFSYDELSNHPDYPVYASAEVLAAMLPLVIDEMLLREDTNNYLIYPITTALDPSGDGHAHIAERTGELARIVDRGTIDKVLKLLAALGNDPPVPIERIDRIVAFWKENASPSNVRPKK